MRTLKVYIIDNIKDKIDEWLLLDSYNSQDGYICGLKTEMAQDELLRAVCNSYFLFSEEARNKHAEQYKKLGEKNNAAMIYNTKCTDEAIIEHIFAHWLPPMLIINGDKGFITHCIKREPETFGFDITSAREDVDEFINEIGIKDIINEVRNYFLSHTWSEFENKYPYDYYL